MVQNFVSDNDELDTKFINANKVVSSIHYKTKFGELPEPIFTRKVYIVVTDKNADELYAYIFKKARINRDQGGAMWQSALAMASPYYLPKGVPMEND